MAFANKLVGMHEDLKKTSRGRPQLPPVVPDALESFKTMSWGQNAELWQFVGLGEVFNYIWGGKRLRIPAKWAPFIPKAYPSIP